MVELVRHVDFLVIHRTENIADFASYHRVIKLDGSVDVYHPDASIASHAKDFNLNSIGIALIGDFATAEPGRNWYPTYQQVVALHRQLKDYYVRYPGAWLVGHTELGPRGTAFPEKLLPAHSCPGTHLDMNDLREFVCTSILSAR